MQVFCMGVFYFCQNIPALSGAAGTSKQYNIFTQTAEGVLVPDPSLAERGNAYEYI